MREAPGKRGKEADISTGVVLFVIVLNVALEAERLCIHMFQIHIQQKVNRRSRLAMVC